MKAKISDLGVARILNLTPLQVSRMTQTPGTPAYMPPEVMIADPKYDTSVDEFSYGILMIHMFSGRWPEPQVGPSRIEADKLIPVTEAERREVFLQAIGNDHLMMNLILRCINNNPERRAHASEIVEQLIEMRLQFPTSFANQLEMLRHIEAQEEEKRTLREEGETESQQKEQIIINLREEAQQKAEESDRLSAIFSSEVEQLKLQVKDLTSQNQLFMVTNKAEVTELKAKAEICEAQVKIIDKTLQQEREQFETQLAKEKSEVSKLRTDINSLQHINLALKADISRKDAAIKRKESELEVKTRVLQEKDVTISGMSEQLTRTREYLATKQQVIKCLVWCVCCLLYTSPSPRDATLSRMPSSA